MKPLSLVGVALIVLGLVALLYQGVTYTSHETVLDIGPLHATADRQKTLPLSPVLGFMALAGGVVLLVYGARKAASRRTIRKEFLVAVP
jgi:hypothetical protein